MGHDFARFKEVAHEVQFCVQKQLQSNSGVEFPWASEPAFCWSFTGKGTALPKQFYCLGGHCSFSRCSVKENTMRRRKSKQTQETTMDSYCESKTASWCSQVIGTYAYITKQVPFPGMCQYQTFAFSWSWFECRHICFQVSQNYIRDYKS